MTSAHKAPLSLRDFMLHGHLLRDPEVLSRTMRDPYMWGDEYTAVLLMDMLLDPELMGLPVDDVNVCLLNLLQPPFPLPRRDPSSSVPGLPYHVSATQKVIAMVVADDGNLLSLIVSDEVKSAAILRLL